jgi:hypothetical protein
MLAIPLQVDAACYDLFVVMKDENIDRLKRYDPAEIVGKNLGMPWQVLRIRNIVILYATYEETQRLVSLTNKEDVVKQLKELSRGWAYRPDRGDNDGQYQNPTKN